MENLTGKQFGHYQIVAPLGEGGMAAVYKAYQPSMERYVAIKVLPRQMATSDEFVARFKLEAKLLAQLQHPHILPVFDYGETDGYTYIVMSFIKSGTLADLIKTRRFSLAEIREIISQVGSALGYAHARGMVHRDVKPSNVLIDESGNCLLTDFGLARMIESTSHLTSSGAIMGTPAYMSPEQGAGTKIDKRSDIYSLGVILFELLTGRVPYTAETPVAVVFKHIQDPLPSVRKYNATLSTEVEMVLYKALAKNPEDRYQTTEDFVRALQQADISEVASAATESPAVEKIAPDPSGGRPAEKPAPVPTRYDAPVAQPGGSYGTLKDEPGAGGEFHQRSAPAYPPSAVPQKTPPKAGDYLGLLTIAGGFVFCVILAGALLLGYQVIASAQLAQAGTVTAEALATTHSIGTATAAVQLTEAAVVQATAAARAQATETARANATATELAIHANATAIWKQATFSDQFNNNSGKWLTPKFDTDNPYWAGFGAIVNGIYQFTVTETKKPFAYWIPYNGMTSNDFDLSVAAKRLGGTADQICYGLYFRAVTEKKYVFVVCDSQHYSIEYFDGEKYNTLREWTQNPAIKPEDWNHLWVSARKNIFTFYVNDVKIDTLTDNTLQSGWTGIFFEVFNSDTPTIQFDNFSFIKY